MDASPFDVCCELASSVEPAANDPIYHPFLYGAQQDGNARAGFYGIAGWHTKGHLVRAVLEGVAFGHRQHIETLRAAGAGFNEAVLSGGGSRSLFWPQIFADVLGRAGHGRALEPNRRTGRGDRRRNCCRHVCRF